MKNIGYTKEGNRLVEMSEDEYREFYKLQMAVEGKTFESLMLMTEHGYREDFDFKNTFHVIKAYYLNRFSINTHRKLLDDMENSLKKE